MFFLVNVAGLHTPLQAAGLPPIATVSDTAGTELPMKILILEWGNSQMGTDRVSTAFAAWMAAHNAWAEALRLLDANRITREEVTALKAEADALFAEATQVLHMVSAAKG